MVPSCIYFLAIIKPSLCHCIIIIIIIVIIIIVITFHSGYKSFREYKGGSWFIRVIVDVLHKHAHDTHLRELFLQVSIIIITIWLMKRE